MQSNSTLHKNNTFPRVMWEHCRSLFGFLLLPTNLEARSNLAASWSLSPHARSGSKWGYTPYDVVLRDRKELEIKDMVMEKHDLLVPDHLHDRPPKWVYCTWLWYFSLSAIEMATWPLSVEICDIVLLRSTPPSWKPSPRRRTVSLHQRRAVSLH